MKNVIVEEVKVLGAQLILTVQDKSDWLNWKPRDKMVS
jgi:hypothetical protein